MVTSETKIVVRYAETDQMGVVYHANYLVWMEMGRTALIENLGFRYAHMEEEGVLAPVTQVNVGYKQPVRYGQTVSVKTWIASYNGLRVTYGYEIYDEETLYAKGTTEHVCVQKSTFRPISLKKTFPDWHAAYERAARREGE
ncbi:acyl-CoA thioesterase [Bacillus fonticola]|uniref:acyl-CoA thioesterase n=1 Tax=Bacillus fonticola TaxID=2728853 RepID=UPI001474D2C6|nr:thioesterase family protein [Bacillus fonticola]